MECCVTTRSRGDPLRPSKEVTHKLRPEGWIFISLLCQGLGKNVPSRENSTCKGPAVWKGLVQVGGAGS